MVCCLLSEWCVATSFYQRAANHVSFYLLFNLRNLLYPIVKVHALATYFRSKDFLIKFTKSYKKVPEALSCS